MIGINLKKNWVHKMLNSGYKHECEGCKFYKWHDLNLYNEPTWVKVCRNPKRENTKESSEKCKLKEK